MRRGAPRGAMPRKDGAESASPCSSADRISADATAPTSPTEQRNKSNANRYKFIRMYGKDGVIFSGAQREKEGSGSSVLAKQDHPRLH